MTPTGDRRHRPLPGDGSARARNRQEGTPNIAIKDIEYWLALLRAPGIGPVTYRSLLSRYDTPRAVLAADRQERASWGVSAATLAYLENPAWDAVQADMEWLEQPGNEAITLHDPAYPALLREISDPPPVLFIRGNKEILGNPQIAMVGSRNPTAGGRQNARQFARELAAAGWTITSGLALGIDAESHRGALEAGGITIAVAGTGLDRVYPASHKELAHQIARQGALVSEFPPGTGPKPEHFPRRNRIISGLSLGTLVVEAALRSGSLITARHAAEQGREVFVLPGSIHNPLSRGCHALIRQGAKLIENIPDILEEFGPLLPPVDATAPAAPAEIATPDHEQRRVLECIGFEPTTIDAVVERSGLTAERVSSILLVLELHDHVASMPGGTYARVSKRV